MTIAGNIRSKILSVPQGQPFTTSCFAKYGSRDAVDRALSRIVKEGEIIRLSRGVFVRPKTNRFIGTVLPGVSKVVQTIARKNGETIQVHGAEAVRLFGFSTQVPIITVFLTNGSSRSIRIVNTNVRMIHTSNNRLLQFAGKPADIAIVALWYLGKTNVTSETVARVRQVIGSKEFDRLLSASLPAWMTGVLNSKVYKISHE